jgi:hypothetical protein
VYFRNQNGMVFSAINKGIDIMHNYRRHHMDTAFYEAHKDTLTQPRGAGYWLWKPYFVLKTMEQYPDDAVIIYADSGVVFTKPIDKILHELKTYDRVLVGQGKPAPLRRHLKREAQIALGIDTKEDILNQQNLWNFFFALKNTPENRAYVKKWLALCQQKDLITDLPLDPLKQEKEFEFHQHDQSMMSVVQAQDPGKTIIIPKNIFRNVYGVNNFHRHPEEQYTSPLLLITGMPMWLSHVLFNNILMTTLRRVMG